MLRLNHVVKEDKMSTRFDACRDDEEGNTANDSCGQSQVRGKLVKLRFIETDSLPAAAK